jgi:cysteine-rich repeat protein
MRQSLPVRCPLRSALFTLCVLAVVATAARATDEPDALMGCNIFLLRPGSLLKVVCRGAFDLPDQPANDPTVDGPSVLRVRDAGLASEPTVYTLPIQAAPLGWKGLGSPVGSKGFKYKGAKTASDPCAVVLVKSTVVKAVCKGTSVGPALPLAGEAAVALTIGSGSKRYCASFGGSDVISDPTQLKRKQAPAPAACTPMCGDGVQEAPEACEDGNLDSGDGCDALCLVEEIVSGSVPMGGTSTTDGEADGATSSDPIETSVTSPIAGTVTITETSATGPAPTGFELFGKEADITAPSASASTPLLLEFLLDASIIRPGEDETTIAVFRNGTLVGSCVGNPGVALPDPCVSERTLLGGGDVRLRVLTSHASGWTFGVPACGNGSLDPGETCDPPGVQAQCSVGQVCKTTCTCEPACDCCALTPARLALVSGLGAGTCGAVTNADGTLFKNLDCNGLYFGGGSSTYVSGTFVDQIQLTFDVAGCDAATERLTLSAATAAETGSPLNCTATGCLFGPPIPLANPGSVVSSTCVIASAAQDATGTATCDGGATIALPVTGAIYLTGDLLPGEPGIQPCPLCVSGSCQGGPNDTLPCVAAGSDLGAAYPTSHDCPPDPSDALSTLTVGATLVTGTATSVATPEGSQQLVFCGFCRDGDGSGNFQAPAQPCASNAECAQPFERCEQRSDGAFGPGGSSAKTISITGTPAGCLADGNPHATTLAGAMCVQPLYSGLADSVADLPGPGAFSFKGTAELQ